MCKTTDQQNEKIINLTPIEKLNIKQIVKRNGEVVDFNIEKIENAIKLAGEATTPFSPEQIIKLTNNVIKVLNHKYDGTQAVFIEKVQDIIEQVLIDANFYETAKAYILYREKRAQSRDSEKIKIDVEKSISEYLNQLDWRVNENANQGYSLGGMILNISGKVVANYWLSYIYPKEIGDAHRNGDFHIHDLSMLS